MFRAQTKWIAQGPILFLAAVTVCGQSFSGKIVGLVTDSSMAAIPKASVTVVNEGTGAQRRLITDASGIYAAAELPVGYVGSKGARLFRVRDINQATPGPVETVQQRRPFNAVYPEFAGIYQLEASANANYNALQIVLRRRLSKGLTLYASHVWSHSIDDASNGICSCTAGVSLPQNSFDKAASSFDQRQRFTLNFVYDLTVLPRALPVLPKRLTGGWQVSGIYTIASGFPITPFWNGAAHGFRRSSEGDLWQCRAQHGDQAAYEHGRLLSGEVDTDQRTRQPAVSCRVLQHLEPPEFRAAKCDC